MARIKTTKAALKRLEEKGVTVKVVKKAQRPAESLNQPAKTTKKKKIAAPKAKAENKALEAEEKVVRPRRWELEVDSRDFQGYIKTLTITEV